LVSALMLKAFSPNKERNLYTKLKIYAVVKFKKLDIKISERNDV
jgi:hypothetical protein